MSKSGKSQFLHQATNWIKAPLQVNKCTSNHLHTQLLSCQLVNNVGEAVELSAGVVREAGRDLAVKDGVEEAADDGGSVWENLQKRLYIWTRLLFEAPNRTSRAI